MRTEKKVRANMFACKEVSSLKDKELEDAYRKESEEKDVCLKGG